jgi:hypothetical protein
VEFVHIALLPLQEYCELSNAVLQASSDEYLRAMLPILLPVRPTILNPLNDPVNELPVVIQYDDEEQLL